MRGRHALFDSLLIVRRDHGFFCLESYGIPHILIENARTTWKGKVWTSQGSDAIYRVELDRP